MAVGRLPVSIGTLLLMATFTVAAALSVRAQGDELAALNRQAMHLRPSANMRDLDFVQILTRPQGPDA